MADQIIRTDKEKEAIYAYSDKASFNFSKDKSISIELYYNRGERILKIKDGGFEKEYSLDPPKKPTGTPVFLLIDSERFEIQ